MSSVRIPLGAFTLQSTEWKKPIGHLVEELVGRLESRGFMTPPVTHVQHRTGHHTRLSRSGLGRMQDPLLNQSLDFFGCLLPFFWPHGRIRQEPKRQWRCLRSYA